MLQKLTFASSSMPDPSRTRRRANIDLLLNLMTPAVMDQVVCEASGFTDGKELGQTYWQLLTTNLERLRKIESRVFPHSQQVQMTHQEEIVRIAYSVVRPTLHGAKGIIGNGQPVFSGNSLQINYHAVMEAISTLYGKSPPMREVLINELEEDTLLKVLLATLREIWQEGKANTRRRTQEALSSSQGTKQPPHSRNLKQEYREAALKLLGILVPLFLIQQRIEMLEKRQKDPN